MPGHRFRVQVLESALQSAIELALAPLAGPSCRVDHSCHKEEVIANAMQQDANEDRGGHHWAILTKSKAP